MKVIRKLEKRTARLLSKDMPQHSVLLGFVMNCNVAQQCC